MMLIKTIIFLIICFQLVNSEMNFEAKYDSIPTALERYLDELLDDCSGKLDVNQIEAGNKLKNDLNDKLRQKQKNIEKCVCSEISFVDHNIGPKQLLDHPYIFYLNRYYEKFGYRTYMKYRHGWPLTWIETPPKTPIYCVAWGYSAL